MILASSSSSFVFIAIDESNLQEWFELFSNIKYVKILSARKHVMVGHFRYHIRTIYFNIQKKTYHILYFYMTFLLSKKNKIFGIR